MKILGIDSSGLVASVAIVEDDRLVAEYNLQYKITHSQTLLPMLEEIRNRIHLDMQTIDAIAVAAGPGSFTGLRIGAATVKGLGLALGKPIIPVPTLEGMAYNCYGTDLLVCPIMDARRNQVYTGLYIFEKEDRIRMKSVMEQTAVGFDELAAKLNVLGREVLFLGDGVPVFAEAMKELLRIPYYFAPAHMNRQRAASVAALGKEKFEQGIFEDAADHAPEYLRLSQAERERQEKA
ncbi:MAG: tRNA (adenosine(37)-N6)-threonylcarbamoyltransferase complex dimerization subunit type 1 TsaB [Lachnospiraceae bacterium]|nr:tRNA (adenosine(37)-N6)-threonylcarbamoyltransferase complex dimerization subunit type 1 TsaB [Lachnospiraceae bacterium]